MEKTTLMAIPIAMLLALLIFLLLPEIRGRDDWERQIDVAVTQASRNCLLNVDTKQKRTFESDLASRLKHVGPKGSTTIKETRRSVNEAFSEAGQMAQDERLRDCVTRRTNDFLNYRPDGSRDRRNRDEQAPTSPDATMTTQGADSGAAVGYVYYEEDEGRLAEDGVFGPVGGTRALRYGDLRIGTVLRSVHGAELRASARGDSPTIRKLGTGQCITIVETPNAPLHDLVEATSGGRIKVRAISCRNATAPAGEG